MENNNIEKKSSFKNWFIKRLLANESTREEILNYIASNPLNENSGKLEDNNEEHLISNILNLDERSVEDVMVPRAEIISLEKKQSIKEIYKIIENEAHSRMPVYDTNLDNVLGFLHVKDLLKNLFNKNFKIDTLMREILYVAPKSPILDLLKRMRSSRIHMGLVVDEFGGVNGLVTIEDLVEEIVGEIEDEHDAEDDDQELIKKISQNSIIVDASFKISDLEEYFNVKIDLENDEEIDTVGGMLFFLTKQVPKNEQIYNFKDLLKFKVIKASARKIITLQITKID
tara:strand:+ start:1270 stop:2124 length:855 start_codon:yes stop_codon:yes gene_type:complete